MKRPEPGDFMYNNNLDIDWIDYSKAQDKCIDELKRQVEVLKDLLRNDNNEQAVLISELTEEIQALKKEVKEQDKSLKSLDKIIKLLTILVFQAKEKVDEAKVVIKSCLVLLKKQKK